VRRLCIALGLATVALAGCAVVPAYPPPPVVVGPPVVRVYPAPPPVVVYRPYYGYRRYY
jgi:hypothetical protein